MNRSKAARFLMAFYPGVLKDLPVTGPAARAAALQARRGALSSSKLREAYETDVFLSAKLLCIANSPFYSASHAFCFDTWRAIERVGVEFATALLRDAEVITDPVELEASVDFWQHCILTAEVARRLSTFSTVVKVPAEAVYWVALVHDIGALIEATFERKRMAEHLRHFAATDVDTDDHCSLACSLAQHWSMPLWMKEVLRWHHDPEQCSVPGARPLIELLHVAHLIGHEDDGFQERPDFERGCIVAGIPLSAISEVIRLKRRVASSFYTIQDASKDASPL